MQWNNRKNGSGMRRRKEKRDGNLNLLLFHVKLDRKPAKKIDYFAPTSTPCKDWSVYETCERFLRHRRSQEHLRVPAHVALASLGKQREVSLYVGARG